jgi:cytidylate kinase
MIITIDGPSASGKSTVARLVAHELGYFYIASGLIFRGLAYALMHARTYTSDTIAHAQEEDIIYCLSANRFDYRYDAPKGEHIIFENEDITSLLKVPAIDVAASVLGTNPIARTYIVECIRALSQHHDIVIDGRDCGSAMFPAAEYKFFLTASLRVRAQRWIALQEKLGKHIPLDQAMTIITERDERDKMRSIAPLHVPQGAHTIDSSAMNAKEVVATIFHVIPH